VIQNSILEVREKDELIPVVVYSGFQQLKTLAKEIDSKIKVLDFDTPLGPLTIAFVSTSTDDFDVERMRFWFGKELCHCIDSRDMYLEVLDDSQGKEFFNLTESSRGCVNLSELIATIVEDPNVQLEDISTRYVGCAIFTEANPEVGGQNTKLKN